MDMFLKVPEIMFKILYFAGGYTNIKMFVNISFQGLLTSLAILSVTLPKGSIYVLWAKNTCGGKNRWPWKLLIMSSFFVDYMYQGFPPRRGRSVLVPGPPTACPARSHASSWRTGPPAWTSVPWDTPPAPTPGNIEIHSHRVSFEGHCNENPIYVFLFWNCAASSPFFTFVCL